MAESKGQAEKLVGIDVSHSRLLAVCIDNSYKVADTLRVNRDRSIEPSEQLGEFLRQAKDKFGVSKFGISVPGLVNNETGNVTFSVQMPENTAINFTDLARQNGVEVVVENDANSAAYAEYKMGAGRGSSNMFYATIGEGIGGAFILGGKVWHGSAGYAGEFGYVAINSDGMRLEDVVSSANIVRRTRNRFNRDSTSSLGRLSEEDIGIKEIVRAADDGDDFAILMLDRTGLYIGTAIASVINLMNIERIVVGGEIMQARHFVIDSIVNRARELSFTPSFEKTQILPGELDEQASAIGAALIANGL